MKPAAFQYLRPASLAEAIALLERHGDDAKLIAGGQSLIPVLNMRLARPAYLIDLGGLSDLDYIREEAGGIAIGGLTRHRQVERSALIRERCPLLTEAVANLAHPQIRNRGTVGGSIAHADPAAELAGVLACLDGRITLTGPAGVRTVSPEEFFLTYFTTTIEPAEIVTEVWFPTLPPGAGYAFLELSRRAGDFAIVGVAVTLCLEATGQIKQSQISLIGVDGTPYRAPELLAGQQPDEAAFAEAARAISEAIEPEGDLHGTAAYRRHLAGVLTRRALVKAYARAQEQLRGGQNHG